MTAATYVDVVVFMYLHELSLLLYRVSIFMGHLGFQI